MPSYRSHLVIGSLRAGQAPTAVEDAARAAVTATTTLEAFQVDLVRGEPRVTVRFTAADHAEAREVHDRVLQAVGAVAALPRVLLAQVVSGRSVPLP